MNHIIEGKLAYFLEPNTDTDVIIPASFLKRTAIDGFEAFSFFEKRYTTKTICKPSIEKEDFVFIKKELNQNCPLNHPNAQNADFLLTWYNFGCGSSREHAVYALKNYKVIIGSAPKGKASFADIFRDNCRQNLIYTPVISEKNHQTLSNYIKKTIDKQSVSIFVDLKKNILGIKQENLNFNFDLPQSHQTYLASSKDPFLLAKEQIQKYLKDIDAWLQNNNFSKISPNTLLK